MQTEDKTRRTVFEAGINKNAREIARWARFISVCGFILSVLLVMVAIFGGSILHNLEQASVSPSRKAGSFSLVMMVGAGITFFLSIFLFLFARSMAEGTGASAVAKAFFHLKIFFRILGCLFILVIIYCLWQVAESFINS